MINISDIWKSISERLNTTVGVVVLISVVMTMGFTAGKYIGDVYSKAEIMELNNKHSIELMEMRNKQTLELIDMRNKQSLEIIALQKNISLLEIKNEKGKK